MHQIIDICTGCDTLQLIQNKTHWLCSDCVFKKNHQGKSREQVYKERHEKKQKNKKDKKTVICELKEKFSIKKISNKRAARHNRTKEVYKKIDNSRPQICEGCDRNFPLSHSHILSEYDRPDLYDDEENIRLHCFGNYDSCHEKWERGNPKEVFNMLDFKENLEYIKSKDIKIYNKIIANFEFYGIKTE